MQLMRLGVCRLGKLELCGTRKQITWLEVKLQFCSVDLNYNCEKYAYSLTNQKIKYWTKQSIIQILLVSSFYCVLFVYLEGTEHFCGNF